ncbi:MAG: 4-hydroxy-tetrahydrodipicolinate synthase [Oscillospiraceae bacterium]
MKKHTIFTGCATAIITPFAKDYSVNFDALEKFVDFQLDNGVKTLVVCGTTGEASTLSDDEQISVIECAVQRARGRNATVIAGAGSNDTRHGVALSRRAAASGADALLHVTPYYNKTTQRGLIEHYRAIASSVSIPIILYNVPSRTGLSIEPATYVQLAEIENIVATKEASGNFTSIASAMNLCEGDLDFYSGNDDQAIPIISLGGKGLISVLSNVKPAETSKMCDLALAGDFKAAAALQISLMPLINALFSEVNPIPIKAAVDMIGFNAGPCRLPLCDMDESKLKKLRSLVLQ